MKNVKDYMQIALCEAQKAERKREVPIGAVIVRDGKVVSRAHNLREIRMNSLCHAEILAIDKACRKLKNWRLDGCEMYVTLEPCQMCMGAIKNARISKVYYGAMSVNKGLNHSVEEYFEENTECGNILREFFLRKRI
jgi:tRNA(adenine34) deaminase